MDFCIPQNLGPTKSFPPGAVHLSLKKDTTHLMEPEKVKADPENLEKSRVIPGTSKDMGPPYGKRDPYHSHIFRDSYGSRMGPAYHKEVPCPWGSLKIPLKKVPKTIDPRARNLSASDMLVFFFWRVFFFGTPKKLTQPFRTLKKKV